MPPGGFRFNRRPTIRRAFASRYARRTSYRRSYPPRYPGTRFQGRKFSRAVTGREVPYYLGPGTEAHVFDSNIYTLPAYMANSASSVAGTYLLNPIERGTGIFQRESQRASMKYVMVRLRTVLQPYNYGAGTGALSTYPVTIRVLLVYTSSQIATINISDFLSNPATGDETFAASGVQRIDSRENHQILYDNKFVLRQTNATTAATPQVEGDFTFKDLDLRIPVRRPVSFTATSTTPIALSDITAGALHLCIVADNLYFTPTSRLILGVQGSARLVFSP